MKFAIYASLLGILALSACDGNNGNVPAIADSDNIVVNNEKMTPEEFLEKYCEGKPDHETCLKVLQSKQQKSTRD